MKNIIQTNSTKNKCVSHNRIVALVIAVFPVIIYADVAQIPNANESNPITSVSYRENPNLFIAQTSLPFGWLSEIYSGYSLLCFGYSRQIPIDGFKNFSTLPGLDFTVFQFTSYDSKYSSVPNYGTYVIFPVRMNLSARSDFKHFSAYSGISLCIPLANFDPLSSTHARTGIEASYWQSHFGVNYRIASHFEIGIKTAFSLTKFKSDDGNGYDNDITLVGAFRY